MSETLRILVIDDEAEFRDIAKLLLLSGGYEVLVAEDGNEGIKKAKEALPNLILLDMRMPGKDGAEVLAELRNTAETKDIKVVFLTNYGDPRPETEETDIHFSEEFGANDYLRKSRLPDELLPKIKAILNP